MLQPASTIDLFLPNCLAILRSDSVKILEKEHQIKDICSSHVLWNCLKKCPLYVYKVLLSSLVRKASVCDWQHLIQTWIYSQCCENKMIVMFSALNAMSKSSLRGLWSFKERGAERIYELSNGRSDINVIFWMWHGWCVHEYTIWISTQNLHGTGSMNNYIMNGGMNRVTTLSEKLQQFKGI